MSTRSSTNSITYKQLLCISIKEQLFAYFCQPNECFETFDKKFFRRGQSLRLTNTGCEKLCKQFDHWRAQLNKKLSNREMIKLTRRLQGPWHIDQGCLTVFLAKDQFQIGLHGNSVEQWLRKN